MVVLKHTILPYFYCKLYSYSKNMAQMYNFKVSSKDHFIDLIKDTARPTYWVPDNEAPGCQLCHIVFGVFDEQDQILKNSNNSNSIRGLDRRRHHCRACGKLWTLLGSTR